MRLNDALETETVPERTQRQSHPTGWEPGMTWNGEGGTLITEPRENEPDPVVWNEIIADWGIDPDLMAIDGAIEFRGYDANIGGGVIQRMKYYKVKLLARTNMGDRADIDDLCAQIAKRKPRKPVVAGDTDHALVVALSDWQIGKGEADGTEGTVDRIMSALDKLVCRIGELRKLGRPPASVYLLSLGDLIEGCSGHYAMQEWQTDLDRREQMRVARRLILAYVDAVAALVPKVVLVAVPGNHGENRKNGKAFTTFTDNDDLTAFELVGEILAANPDRYGHVTVMCADGLSTAIEIHGAVVGLAHMHQGRSGSNPQQKVENWWKGHALGRGKVADADILMTGHYHHLVASESTGRTWFQMPALDPGSAWFTEATGQHSPPGLFTVTVGVCHAPRMWADMAVL